MNQNSIPLKPGKLIKGQTSNYDGTLNKKVKGFQPKKLEKVFRVKIYHDLVRRKPAMAEGVKRLKMVNRI